MDLGATTAYLFEGFRLDLQKRRLSGPAGQAVGLSGRAFDVLAYLVEQRGRLVSKEELLRAVWPRLVVEENNLNQAVHHIRKALGDSWEQPRFLVTVPSRGFQFIAETEVERWPAPHRGGPVDLF
jgi:DNA-binding winged helix-turn-helix (wHTH) protein